MSIETLFNKKNKLSLSFYCSLLSIFFRFEEISKDVFLFGFPSGFLTLHMKTNSFRFRALDPVSLLFDILFFYFVFSMILRFINKLKSIKTKYLDTK